MVSGNFPKNLAAAQHQSRYIGTPGCYTPLTEHLQLFRETRENKKYLPT